MSRIGTNFFFLFQTVVETHAVETTHLLSNFYLLLVVSIRAFGALDHRCMDVTVAATSQRDD